MDGKIVLFAILVFTAIFSISTVDYAAAQSSDAMPDGGDYKEGEGKSCPSKEKKEASIAQTFL